jgi:hypothetical protein
VVLVRWAEAPELTK